MSKVNVDAMEPAVFGQIAEQVVGNRGGYDAETQAAVIERVVREGEVIGRTAIVKVMHDGEVGAGVTTVPKPVETIDILSQGV